LRSSWDRAAMKILDDDAKTIMSAVRFETNNI